MNSKNIGLTIGLIVIILLALLLFFGQKTEDKKEDKINDIKKEIKKEVVDNKEEKKVEQDKTTNEVKDKAVVNKEIVNKKNNLKLEEGKTYTTESGIKYEVIKLGTGEKPKATDTVEVAYVGKLVNGKEFDSSKGEKISFGLNQVIAGWTEGLQLMPVGSKFKFTIPARLAYGEKTICWPTAELDKERERIPKEAFVGKKCTFTNPKTSNQEPGEVMIKPRAPKLAGRILVFDVELFNIKK